MEFDGTYVVSMWHICGKIYTISINIFQSAFKNKINFFEKKLYFNLKKILRICEAVVVIKNRKKKGCEQGGDDERLVGV